MDGWMLEVGGLLAAFVSAALFAVALARSMARRLHRSWHAYLRWVSNARNRLYLETPVKRLAWLALSAPVFGLLAMLVAGMPVLTAIFGAGALTVLMVLGLHQAWYQRLRTLQTQVEPMLDLLAGRLKVSPDLKGALSAVGRTMAPPMSQELSLAANEAYLLSEAEALDNLARRVPLRPIRLLALGLKQVRPLGGDAHRLVDNIAGIVRETIRLEMLVARKTASGRREAWILAAVPPAALAMMHIKQPTLVEPLFSTFHGQVVLCLAGVMTIGGLVWALRIMHIEV